MTVPVDSGSGTPYISYTGDGTSTAFAVPFTFDSSSELEVIERVTATGAETVKTISTHYTVSGGSGSTGTVTAVAAPSSSVQWHIRRKTLRSQTDNFVTNDAFRASTFNARLDKITRQIQDVWELASRAIRFKRTEHPTAEVDQKSTRAGRVIGFDASGNLTTYDPVEGFDDPDDGLASLGARRAAAVILRRVDPFSSDVVWKAYSPEGALIPTAGTTTDGFAEAHAAAQTGIYNLIVDGGGIASSLMNANVLNLQAAQTIGPADSAVYEMRGVNFNFVGFVTSGTALTVDSFSKGRITFDGQVVCSHAGVALEFRPTSNHTSDSNKNQGVGSFAFRVVQNASTDSGAVVVKFNAQNGESLNGSEYSFLEINGGRVGAQFTAAGTGVITDCRFDLWGVHDFHNGSGGIGVEIGAGVDTNVFRIGSTTPASADATLKIAGRANVVEIHEKGSNAVKITLDSAAVKNEIHVWSATASGCTVTDNASTKSNSVYFNGALVLEPQAGSWTPAIDFVTAGDLSVSYSTRVGTYVRKGRLVTVYFDITTSAFTHTTASGTFRITGLPFASASGQNYAGGDLAFQGITKASYSQFTPQANAGAATLNIQAAGSGQTLAALTASDVPTGGTVVLRGSATYETAA